MEDLEKKVAELQKELDHAKRRNKTLKNRIRRMEEETKKLVEELDTKEALESVLAEERDDVCPDCGSELMVFNFPNGKGVTKCKRMPVCKYTKPLK
jgi:DNA repair exonuclease SbcCD ATPase subunit